ncbi:solute carrier family 35 member B1 isoform X4 [Serinus canaria]|uniref:solute carrier family 35 member B1 isoform X4 n=1 Tax=Serinus canaria TaxID=9135 RepID=UPI0021CD0EF1|nr:solute carrier family 35 member B1 isoform X4 [Serinus canaria]
MGTWGHSYPTQVGTGTGGHGDTAVTQLPHPGAGQVLQTHPSDAAGGDPAEEEVPPSQVPVRAAHRGRGGPVPLQAQKRDRGHRAHLWLRGAAPAAVADPGRAHGGVPGPHEGSLPDRLQPHDAQRQPLVHAVPGGRDPVHGGALGVPEFHGALSQHHLQHPPLRPHQRPGPEFHLHDRGVLRAPDLLHHHHHPQVLHHPGLRGALCQPHQPHAVGGHRPGVPGPWARCQIREGGEEDVALRWIGRSRSWNELLIYCLVPQNLVWNWTQDRESEGNHVGFIFGLSLVWFFNSKWSLKCNPLV